MRQQRLQAPRGNFFNHIIDAGAMTVRQKELWRAF
jgi:hypothetical protein